MGTAFLTAGIYDVLVSTSNSASQNPFMPVKGNKRNLRHQQCESAAFIFTGICEYSFVVLTKGSLLPAKQKVASCKVEEMLSQRLYEKLIQADGQVSSVLKILSGRFR